MRPKDWFGIDLNLFSKIKTTFMKVTFKMHANAYTLLLCLYISLLFTQTSCHHPIAKSKQWRDYIAISKDHYPTTDSSQQVVVWRTPNSDPTYLNTWLDSIYRHCGPFHITLFCGSCDSSLMLLTGNGIRTFIQGNGGGSGGGTTCQTNCPPGGGGDTIYWGVNYPVEMADTLDYIPDTTKKQTFVSKILTQSPVVAGVFDTGVDTLDLSAVMYKNPVPTCLDLNANNGWDFPKENNNVQDDYNLPIGHGKNVARLIAEQVNAISQNPVKILPLKTHSWKGESDLFSILCGFAYAKERGAQIINASFGYYALKRPPVGGVPSTANDNDAMLLKQYIKYYLTNNNILLIAAAGNKNMKNNDAAEKALYTNAGLPVPADLRNLDEVYFYPASLAADPDLPNVIAVTTIDDQTNIVSPNQNFSHNVVDIGVNNNVNTDADLWFRNPIYTGHLVRGTSYAAPIVAGIICGNYSRIQQHLSDNSLAFTKQNILRFLLTNPSTGHVNTVLSNKIKTGEMIDQRR